MWLPAWVCLSDRHALANVLFDLPCCGEALRVSFVVLVLRFGRPRRARKQLEHEAPEVPPKRANEAREPNGLREASGQAVAGYAAGK